MNYYSRNSPSKRKLNPPPGFLIPDRMLIKPKRKSERGIKSHFNISFRQPFSTSELEDEDSFEQMLVLDEDIIYIPTNDEILIEDEQQNPSKPTSGFNQSIERKKLQYEQNPNPNQPIKNEGGFVPESRPGFSAKFEDQQNVDKYFYRNYSFGDKNETENRKQPYIKKIFNIGPEQQGKQKLSKSIVSKNSQKTGLRPRLAIEQGWSKIVKNFIKKRSNSPTQNQSQTNNLTQRNKQQLQQNKSNEEVEEQQSSGVFRKSSQDSIFQDRNNQAFSHRNDQQIKIQQQDQEDPIQTASEEKVEEDHHSQQSQQQKFAFKSIKLLGEAISELPQSLIPSYIKIQEELERRQYEARMTIKRMQETQSMIVMLIQAHRKKLNVDTYILEEQQSKSQNRIKANREIIFALSRKLASFFS